MKCDKSGHILLGNPQFKNSFLTVKAFMVNNVISNPPFASQAGAVVNALLENTIPFILRAFKVFLHFHNASMGVWLWPFAFQ